jgi:hypothetical protein
VGTSVITGTADGRLLKEYGAKSLYNGATYPRRILTPWLDFGSTFYKKECQRFFINLKNKGPLDLTVNVRLDYNPAIRKTETIRRSTSGSSYGSAQYGNGVYASDGTALDHFPIEGKFKSIQLEFLSSESDTQAKIVSYGFEVSILDAY